MEKNKESEAIWRIDALRSVLKEVHSLFMMFNGSIRAMLEEEPRGGLIRSHLYPFVMDYLHGKAYAVVCQIEFRLNPIFRIQYKIFHCKSLIVSMSKAVSIG